jgi:hypothetical protein
MTDLLGQHAAVLAQRGGQKNKGITQMQIVKAYDDASTYAAFITGVSGIEEIAPDVVRLSFYVEQEDSHGGQKEKKVVDHQLWSIVQLYEALATIQSVMSLMAATARKETPVTYLPAPVVH